MNLIQYIKGIFEVSDWTTADESIDPMQSAASVPRVCSESKYALLISGIEAGGTAGKKFKSIYFCNLIS